MAYDFVDIFERMYDAMRDISSKMRDGDSGNSGSSQNTSTDDEDKPWNWLERLLSRLFGDLESELNKATPKTIIPPSGYATPANIGSPGLKVTPVSDDGSSAVTLKTEAEAQREDWVKYGKQQTQGMQDFMDVLPNMESQAGGKAQSKLSEGLETGQLAARAAVGDPTAMIALADKAVKKMENQIAAGGESVKSFGKAMTQQDSFFGTASTLADSAKSGLEFVGMEDTAAGQLVDFGKAVAESVDRLRDMSRAMVDANLQFAEYSASMAAVEGRQEFRDIALTREKGEARAETTEDLAEAMSELNETLLPLENAWANFSNELMTQIIKLVTMWAKVDPVLTSIRIMLEALVGLKEKDDQGDKGMSFGEFLMEESKNYARPPRMPPG